MTRILRTWLPPVSLCLLLQASIVGGGVLLNRWFEGPKPAATTDFQRSGT